MDGLPSNADAGTLSVISVAPNARTLVYLSVADIYADDREQHLLQIAGVQFLAATSTTPSNGENPLATTLLGRPCRGLVIFIKLDIEMFPTSTTEDEFNRLMETQIKTLGGASSMVLVVIREHDELATNLSNIISHLSLGLAGRVETIYAQEAGVVYDGHVFNLTHVTPRFMCMTHETFASASTGDYHKIAQQTSFFNYTYDAQCKELIEHEFPRTITTRNIQDFCDRFISQQENKPQPHSSSSSPTNIKSKSISAGLFPPITNLSTLEKLHKLADLTDELLRIGDHINVDSEAARKYKHALTNDVNGPEDLAAVLGPYRKLYAKYQENFRTSVIGGYWINTQGIVIPFVNTIGMTTYRYLKISVACNRPTAYGIGRELSDQLYTMLLAVMVDANNFSIPSSAPVPDLRHRPSRLVGKVEEKIVARRLSDLVSVVGVEHEHFLRLRFRCSVYNTLLTAPITTILPETETIHEPIQLFVCAKPDAVVAAKHLAAQGSDITLQTLVAGSFRHETASASPVTLPYNANLVTVYETSPVITIEHFCLANHVAEDAMLSIHKSTKKVSQTITITITIIDIRNEQHALDVIDILLDAAK